MRIVNRSSLLLTALVAALPAISLGAPPPNVVESDADKNTAMGTSALGKLTDGAANTAAGSEALFENTEGDANTGFGTFALYRNKVGEQNTAVGRSALQDNVASFNTAVGARALVFNTTGGSNSALGSYALANNTTGIDNTAVGATALTENTEGIWNTAIGSRALGANLTGRNNTANGFAALDANTGGSANTAIGSRALFSNTTGLQNAATGYAALYKNRTGINNVALGYQALYLSTTGMRNVGIGFQAGYGVNGSDNITIGGGNRGRATESGVIRIGTSTYQSKAFIAGVTGVTTGLATARAVFIDGNGQLGTVQSSRVYKEDIRAMGSVSERLLALRPVTFRYKQPYDDGSKPIEFGLIAEEVAQAFPELVVHDAKGKPETVRYDLVATLLLNEFQKDHKLLQAQANRIDALEKQAQAMAQLKSSFALMTAMVERLQRERMVAAAR